MRKVKVYVSGCDDSTSVIIKVTEAQYKFLETLTEEVNKASEYGCQPTMGVYDAEENTED